MNKPSGLARRAFAWYNGKARACESGRAGFHPPASPFLPGLTPLRPAQWRGSAGRCARGSRRRRVNWKLELLRAPGPPSLSSYLVSPEVKQQILGRIREGIPIKQLAEEHGMKPQAIYAWLGKGVTAPPTFLEFHPL